MNPLRILCSASSPISSMLCTARRHLTISITDINTRQSNKLTVNALIATGRGRNNCGPIREIPTGVLKYIRRFRGNVKWPPWMDDYIQAPNWTSFWRRPTCAQCTLPSGINHHTMYPEENRPIVKRRNYRASHNRMGRLNRHCTEKDGSLWHCKENRSLIAVKFSDSWQIFWMD